MVRIQHIDAKQGPILKHYGLTTLTFSTAAGSHEIPALTESTAEQVHRQIATLARLIDEEI
ncbi:PH domain-containing protein [Paenibacillus sepulcri]